MSMGVAMTTSKRAPLFPVDAVLPEQVDIGLRGQAGVFALVAREAVEQSQAGTGRALAIQVLAAQHTEGERL